MGGQRLLCRFVQSGPGSLRQTIYDGRMDLRGKSKDKELFIAESLTKRYLEILTYLLPTRKAGKIYTVFTKYGRVFVKIGRHDERMPVDSMAKAKAIIESCNRGSQ